MQYLSPGIWVNLLHIMTSSSIHFPGDATIPALFTAE